jgi:DnaJ-class molecular chaperone
VRKLVECEHCHGMKTCTSSGGRSCRDCLAAAGKRLREFATVRCSYCGGRGKVWVEEEEGAEESAESADE